MAKKKRENNYDEDYFELIIDFENDLITHSLLKNLQGEGHISNKEKNAGLIRLMKTGNRSKSKRSSARQRKSE